MGVRLFDHKARYAKVIFLRSPYLFSLVVLVGCGILSVANDMQSDDRSLIYQLFSIVLFTRLKRGTWPVFLSNLQSASNLFDRRIRKFLRRYRPLLSRPSSMKLWEERDPRIDSVCFTANVPSFVLNQDQQFIEWNPAFALIFSRLPGVVRGGHVSIWYDQMDNFRRVVKRTEKLYGEGILPITDRERICFQSPQFGRMVFTRIMTPIIDRKSAKIVGWNVVLNINSVSKRSSFFEEMYRAIALETRRVRHAAGIDGLLKLYPYYRDLIELHCAGAQGSFRVLDVGAQTGNLSLELLRRGHRVVAVDRCTQQLRKLRLKSVDYPDQLQIVRKDLSDLTGLTPSKYQAATMMLSIHKIEDPTKIFRQVYDALADQGCFSVSYLLPTSGIDRFFEDIKSFLEYHKKFHTLKYQFQHVLDHERELALSMPYRFYSREDIRAYLIEAGFEIEKEEFDLLQGHAQLISARKRNDL